MNHGWPWHQARCTLIPVLADALRALQTALGEPTTQETSMTWEKPAACNMRFGFEITMYIANR
jgi:coenzyme PQQ precursor peptide PqqA